ncbi:MAG: LysO family transporter [Candidatus Delongbacteria bacterium]|nr:LysO family transporter [Candidatus Delongbacteria bacterium]
MNSVLVALVIGGLTGYFLKERKALLKHLDKITFYSLLALLFFLGLSVGANEVIVKNLHSLGMKAFVISLSAVLGSAAASWIVYRIFFRGTDEK